MERVQNERQEVVTNGRGHGQEEKEQQQLQDKHPQPEIVGHEQLRSRILH